MRSAWKWAAALAMVCSGCGKEEGSSQSFPQTDPSGHPALPAFTGQTLPQVGDAAVFSIQIFPPNRGEPGDRVERSGTMIKRIVRYDGRADLFEIESESKMDNSPAVRTSAMLSSDKMRYGAHVDMTLRKCRSLGGIPENLTVRAGTFLTCHEVRETARTLEEKWTGFAPFGEIRFSTFSKQGRVRTVRELVSYSLSRRSR